MQSRAEWILTWHRLNSWGPDTVACKAVSIPALTIEDSEGWIEGGILGNMETIQLEAMLGFTNTKQLIVFVFISQLKTNLSGEYTNI